MQKRREDNGKLTWEDLGYRRDVDGELIEPKDKISFTLNWVPASLNKSLRQHWRERSRQRDVCAGYIVEAIGKRDMPEQHKVRVTVQMFRWAPLDRDNAYGACKIIFDCLRRLGWALGDSEKDMEMVVPEVLVDRKHPRCEISIERLQ